MRARGLSLQAPASSRGLFAHYLWLNVHGPSEPFVVGRLSRVDAHKWHPETWRMYDRIAFRPLRARVMAWDDCLTSAVGSPPVWVEKLSGGDEAPQDFLALPVR